MREMKGRMMATCLEIAAAISYYESLTPTLEAAKDAADADVAAANADLMIALTGQLAASTALSANSIAITALQGQYSMQGCP